MKTHELLTLAGNAINTDIFEVAPGSATKAVVVAYGTEGMNAPFNAQIEDVCTAIAKEGFLVVLPYYFESSGTSAGLSGVAADLTSKTGFWIDTLVAAVVWAKGKVGGGNVAFVGFSLGANQVLNAALKVHVSAVVDYYGPVNRFGLIEMPDPPKLTKARVASLPPTLIHHGKRDLIVRPSQSEALKGWLDSHGVDCIYLDNYDCGHPGQPELEWTDAASDESTAQTVKFLTAQL